VQLDPPPAWAYFWFGLVGIIATGFMLALGSDYWAIARQVSFGPNPVKAFAVLVALAGLVVVFDICAFGVTFAGGVMLIQRLRGRI
jgi:hypothetical protein